MRPHREHNGRVGERPESRVRRRVATDRKTMPVCVVGAPGQVSRNTSSTKVLLRALPTRVLPSGGGTDGKGRLEGLGLARGIHVVQDHAGLRRAVVAAVLWHLCGGFHPIDGGGGVDGRWMRGKGCSLRLDTGGHARTASRCRRESITRGE